jgi:hypothetical protein
VGEVKMQGYLFCDSGAHEILLLSLIEGMFGE